MTRWFISYYKTATTFSRASLARIAIASALTATRSNLLYIENSIIVIWPGKFKLRCLRFWLVLHLSLRLKLYLKCFRKVMVDLSPNV